MNEQPSLRERLIEAIRSYAHGKPVPCILPAQGCICPKCIPYCTRAGLPSVADEGEEEQPHEPA